MKKLYTSILALGTLFYFNVNAQDINTGLVAHYNFDGNTIQDTTGNNPDGHFFNPVYGSGHEGGACLQFRQQLNDQIAFIESGIIAINEDFTISHWFYLNSINNQEHAYTLNSRKDSLGNEQGGVDFLIDKNDGTYSVVLRRKTPFADLVSLRTSDPLVTNTWYNATLTREDSIVKLYMNGTLAATDTTYPTTEGVPTNPYFWSIGAMFNPGSTIVREMNGLVDDISFYNRVLTQNDIYALLGTSSFVNEFETIDVNLYPNPASDVLTIQTNQVVLSVEIYDLRGSLILSTSKQLVDISDLSCGTYLVHVNTPDGRKIKKVLKY